MKKGKTYSIQIHKNTMSNEQLEKRIEELGQAINQLVRESNIAC